ncbi:ArsR family transcriptional regulator [Heyndrickxia shackletonii]|uniref:ArsR family transcriptional regulator n=1 Tax=Heyndrickxia shackletonii TaxID=157838 RepID=A0A0Q3TN08_9BACI|nr:metalloregulator ArsR/SmtB family transcription factor [Heyndrickxia shackletonii]KQL55145.1 ArsR family transcriptional regulator [Heyndrickxia shackletonii]NEY98662.1 winged helix-turn-helix transcriptional regulator [Heyndrickxia shackletonii]
MTAKEELNITTAAGILKLLGDKTRLSMVKIMSEHEVCVCELVDLFEISQPAISQHVKKLKDNRLIKERRGAQWIYYSLNPEFPYYDYLLNVIKDLPSQKYKIEESCQNCCD